MNHLFSFLRLEVAKYKDIDHIFAKLEQDGEIQKIYDLFKTIFVSESEFTLGGKKFLLLESVRFRAHLLGDKKSMF